MADLLCELGLEEIPARFLPSAQLELKRRGEEALKENGFLFQSLSSWVTPRRLSLYARELSFDKDRTASRKKGPPERIAYDETGKPTAALLGFLRKESAELSQVERENGYIFITQLPAATPLEALGEILPSIFAALPFPKMMRWEDGEYAYVRPLRWICALWGAKLIHLRLFGIESERRTLGHRFFSGTIELDCAEEYRSRMEENFVLLDPLARKERIERLSDDLAKQIGGKPVWADDFKEELVHLFEYPTPFLGSFPERYLSLPQDVLITVMRHHQKQVPIKDEEGNPIPYFICFRDGPSLGEKLIVRGNKQALRGRLEDACLFFRNDQKKRLEDRIPDLEDILLHKKLGSIRDKVERIEETSQRLLSSLPLVSDLSREAQVARVAYLAKADLTTAMVQELPELQGIMGREYALLQGEEEEVARGIAEHYLPRFPGDALPTGFAGMIVGIADRIDTLLSFFSLGLEPTGSADPFALRRCASGLNVILVQPGAPSWQFGELLSLGSEALSKKISLPAGIVKNLADFLVSRLRSMLEDRGLSYEIVSCALNLSNQPAESIIPSSVVKKGGILQEKLDQAELRELVLSYKRIKNILRRNEAFAAELHLELMEEVEKNLYRANGEVDPGGEPEDLFLHLCALTPKISRFFDQIMIMTEERAKRENRLALLNKVMQTLSAFGDFSALPF